MGSGRPRQFPLEYDETLQVIKQYKEDTANNLIDKPCIPDFLARIGIAIDTWFDVIDNPNDKNQLLSEALKNFAAWCDAEVIRWGTGTNYKLAALLLNQGFSGHKYTMSNEVKQDSKMEINVKFGSKCKDPFG